MIITLNTTRKEWLFAAAEDHLRFTQKSEIFNKLMISTQEKMKKKELRPTLEKVEKKEPPSQATSKIDVSIANVRILSFIEFCS